MNTVQSIKAGWLIDGSGGPVRKNMLLTVKSGFFTEIAPCVGCNTPDRQVVTDFSDCTLLPPLVDCHVHLSMSGCTDLQARKEQQDAEYDTIAPAIGEHLHHHFIHGVLAVRDGGDHRGHTLRFKNESDEHRRDPVIFKTAGRAKHRKGRYGRVIGHHLPEGETPASAFLKENMDIDQVKLINSGLNSLNIFGRETAPQFTLDQLKELVQQARQKGKKVMVHANGEHPVRLAIEAGCDSIEHGFFMGKENLKRMAATRTTWVPTACTMKAFAEDMAPGTPGIDLRVVEQNLHHQLKQMMLAKQYGVPVALGTDAGSPGVLHGESMIEELKLIMEAGHSLTEAVQCTAANGARLLGLNTTGRIEKGQPAHFIVARGAPAMLPGRLSSLESIYLDGTPCSTKFFQKR